MYGGNDHGEPAEAPLLGEAKNQALESSGTPGAKVAWAPAPRGHYVAEDLVVQRDRVEVGGGHRQAG